MLHKSDGSKLSIQRSPKQDPNDDLDSPNSPVFQFDITGMSETTMIEYLSLIFEEDIHADILQTGLIENITSSPNVSTVKLSNSIRPSKFSWIKRIFNHRNSQGKNTGDHKAQ